MSMVKQLSDKLAGMGITLPRSVFEIVVEAAKESQTHSNDSSKSATVTLVRIKADGTWSRGVQRPIRGLDAMVLDDSVKEVVKEVESFLSPETRTYYANRGIPWRRGYLFYGHSGCGKTTFTTALAAHFKLPIYIISLSFKLMSDEFLADLFEQRPAGPCIILLEKVDGTATLRDTKITRSGIHNLLDGVHSKEGVITIMTTNSPDILRHSLIRPGRIDRKVLFGYASTEVVRKLFVHMFTKHENERVTVQQEDDKEDDNDEDDERNLSNWADYFAEAVPGDKFTPAEIQGYLLQHRGNPYSAMDGATEWMRQMFTLKKSGKNVEEYTTEQSKNYFILLSSRVRVYATDPEFDLLFPPPVVPEDHWLSVPQYREESRDGIKNPGGQEFAGPDLYNKVVVSKEAVAENDKNNDTEQSAARPGPSDRARSIVSKAFGRSR